MTLLPLDSWQIEPLRGEEWPDYKVAPLCALSTCSQFTDHAHHIVRRSFMAGAYSWVKLPDGTAVGNLMPLCWRHHQLVTENKARIEWEEESKTFFWRENGDAWRLSQPPLITSVREGQVEQSPQEKSCPTCGTKIRPKVPHKHEEKRPRKTWTITVPEDAREIGADILDTLLESARLILDERGLSYGEDRSLRYFVLSTALGLFVAHSEEILSPG